MMENSKSLIFLVLVSATFVSVPGYSVSFFDGRFTLDWEISRQNVITFTASAQTTGWVGFGINTVQSLVGAQLVVAGIHGGVTFPPASPTTTTSPKTDPTSSDTEGSTVTEITDSNTGPTSTTDNSSSPDFSDGSTSPTSTIPTTVTTTNNPGTTTTVITSTTTTTVPPITFPISTEIDPTATTTELPSTTSDESSPSPTSTIPTTNNPGTTTTVITSTTTTTVPPVTFPISTEIDSTATTTELSSTTDSSSSETPVPTAPTSSTTLPTVPITFPTNRQAENTPYFHTFISNGGPDLGTEIISGSSWRFGTASQAYGNGNYSNVVITSTSWERELRTDNINDTQITAYVDVYITVLYADADFQEGVLNTPKEWDMRRINLMQPSLSSATKISINTFFLQCIFFFTSYLIIS